MLQPKRCGDRAGLIERWIVESVGLSRIVSHTEGSCPKSWRYDAPVRTTPRFPAKPGRNRIVRER